MNIMMISHHHQLTLNSIRNNHHNNYNSHALHCHHAHPYKNCNRQLCLKKLSLSQQSLYQALCCYIKKVIIKIMLMLIMINIRMSGWMIVIVTVRVIRKWINIRVCLRIMIVVIVVIRVLVITVIILNKPYTPRRIIFSQVVVVLQ